MNLLMKITARFLLAFVTFFGGPPVLTLIGVLGGVFEKIPRVQQECVIISSTCAVIYIGLSFLVDRFSSLRKVHQFFYLVSSWLSGAFFFVSLMIVSNVRVNEWGIPGLIFPFIGGIIGIGLAMVLDRFITRKEREKVDGGKDS